MKDPLYRIGSILNSMTLEVIEKMDELANKHMASLGKFGADGVNSAPDVPYSLPWQILDWAKKNDFPCESATSHAVGLHTDPQWFDKIFVIFIYSGQHKVYAVKSKRIYEVSAKPGDVLILDPLVAHCATPLRLDANMIYNTLEIPRDQARKYLKELQTILKEVET